MSVKSLPCCGLRVVARSPDRATGSDRRSPRLCRGGDLRSRTVAGSGDPPQRGGERGRVSAPREALGALTRPRSPLSKYTRRLDDHLFRLRLGLFGGRLQRVFAAAAAAQAPEHLAASAALLDDFLFALAAGQL